MAESVPRKHFFVKMQISLDNARKRLYIETMRTTQATMKHSGAFKTCERCEKNRPAFPNKIEMKRRHEKSLRQQGRFTERAAS
jgi:hypothetical protein